MELDYFNPLVKLQMGEQDQQEKQVFLFDGTFAYITDEGKELYLDRNGQKARLVRTAKNERGGRARPDGSKHSGQLTFQLKVEITDQYFIK